MKNCMNCVYCNRRTNIITDEIICFCALNDNDYIVDMYECAEECEDYEEDFG